MRRIFCSYVVRRESATTPCIQTYESELARHRLKDKHGAP
jgi:hypothetical protein